MRTEALPLQALNQAIVCAEETTGLIHHSDHGSQYVSVIYNERLAQHGIAASTGTVGDSYDNALAENVDGYYKHELIHTRRWNDVVEEEIATLKWGSWWNETRLHHSLGYRTPSRGRHRILEAEPVTGNNRNQGKCRGTKLGALQSCSDGRQKADWFRGTGRLVCSQS